jgi:DNA-binding LacI/PurR family transcriptional regulator
VAAGIPRDSTLEVQGDFTESSGFVSGLELLRRERRPTAVFAANDYMAIGLLRALRDAKVSVPRDMAVVGFDDIEFARYLDPPLTTVHVDAYALGEGAAHTLVRRMRSPRPSRACHAVLPATLAVRGSCGAGDAGGAEVASTRRRRFPRSSQEEPLQAVSSGPASSARRVSKGGEA